MRPYGNTKQYGEVFFVPRARCYSRVSPLDLKRSFRYVSYPTQRCNCELFISAFAFKQLLHNEEDSIAKASEEASQQIVNCLVENVLSLEERAVGKF